MAVVFFFLTFFLFAAFGVLFLLLYGTRVLPFLGESVEFLLSNRYSQIERYVKLVDEAGETNWYIPLLRRIKLIQTIMVFLLFIVFGLVFLVQRNGT
jgi:hypothetical protein